MSTLLNLIWFVFGGELLALIWLIFVGLFESTVVGLPLTRVFLEFAKLSAFPFGKEVIRDTELKGRDNVSTFSKVVSVLLNILWFPIRIITYSNIFTYGNNIFLYGSRYSRSGCLC